MTASRSLGPVRLIRPLLAWPKIDLVATCAASAQPFIEDPSNRSSAFARPVLRRQLAGDRQARAGLLERARNEGETRHQLGKSVAAILGRIASIGPDGIGLLDREALSRAAPGPRMAALAAMVRTIGGGAYAPDDDALATLDESLKDQRFRGASLGGCLVRAWRGSLLVCREAGRAAPSVALPAGRWQRWDDRFDFRAATAGLAVAALGAAGYAACPKPSKTALAAVAGAGLPAIRDCQKVVAVPAFGWPANAAPAVEMRLSPLWPLASETFTVVSAGADIMSDRGERGRR